MYLFEDMTHMRNASVLSELKLLSEINQPLAPGKVAFNSGPKFKSAESKFAVRIFLLS